MSGSADLPKAGKKFYHVRVSKGEVGRFVLLPGDPDRVPVIASFLKRPEQVSSHREFTIWNGYAGNELVTVASTGIGSPAAAIAVEELSRAGADSFIRVGTCGAIQPNIRIGDLIIATAAIRMEGTTKQYIGEGYPAFADPQFSLALASASHKLGYRFHMGIAASTDSFYVGQARPGRDAYMPSSARGMLEDLRRARVLCFEMESAAIFTLASIYGLRAGAIFAAIANRAQDKLQVKGEREVSRTAVEAVRILIEWDKDAKERNLPFWLPK